MNASPDDESWIRGLPKAELHVHLQGAASVETVLDLSRRHPGAGIPVAEDELRRFYEFRDFAHFVDVYIAVNRLIRSADDIRALVVGVGRDLASHQVRYAEVTVTPDAHLLAGIAPQALSEALDAGREEVLAEHAVALAWVFDIPGGLGPEPALRTIEWVERFRPPRSVGFGLGGPEAGVPRRQFADLFRRAADAGLASVPHAGETTGPQTVRDALDHLGAVRIGHGIAAAGDPELLVELAERGVVLEVCPWSNVRTRAVARIEDHPLPELMDAGVRVTLNTDDPGMFDTDLDREYLTAHRTLGLGLPDLADLAREAVTASFAPEVTKRRLLAEIADYLAEAPAPIVPA